jgi:malate synthase
VIRYRNGVLNGRGASLLDGYMEDLATDRIYRLMIAQRMKHANAVDIFDENGQAVRHTPELIHELFDQELERLQQEGAKTGETTQEQAARLGEARRLSEDMVLRGEFNPA